VYRSGEADELIDRVGWPSFCVSVNSGLQQDSRDDEQLGFLAVSHRPVDFPFFNFSLLLIE